MRNPVEPAWGFCDDSTGAPTIGRELNFRSAARSPAGLKQASQHGRRLVPLGVGHPFKDPGTNADSSRITTSGRQPSLNTRGLFITAYGPMTGLRGILQRDLPANFFTSRREFGDQTARDGSQPLHANQHRRESWARSGKCSSAIGKMT